MKVLVEMESWLTIIVRLVVIGLVAVVAGTVLQSTSQQLAGKLFNYTAQPELEENAPVASQKSGNVWVAVAGGLATFVGIYGAVHVFQFRRFAASVNVIEKLGGKVNFVPPQQNRFRAYLYSESTVDLSGSSVDDGNFPELVNLRRLLTLRVDNTDIADVAASEIGKCKMLKALDLSNTKIGDAGLQQLVTLSSLKNLILNDTPVTDDSIPTILSFGSLVKLECTNTAISPSGVEEIQSQAPQLDVEF